MSRHIYDVEMNICMCCMLFTQADDMTGRMAHLSYTRN